MRGGEQEISTTNKAAKLEVDLESPQPDESEDWETNDESVPLVQRSRGPSAEASVARGAEMRR